MRTFDLSHVSDDALPHDLDASAFHNCHSAAWLLAHIAEFDARRLYLPAGFPSMVAYCVTKLSGTASLPRVPIDPAAS